MEALYAQLFGVGVLWVTIHCSGMCGPIMAGLAANACAAPTGDSAVARVAPRVRGVLAYQAGRLVTYLALGALAGTFGLAMEGIAQQITRIAGLVASLVMIAIALAQLGVVREDLVASSKLGVWLGRAIKGTARVLPRRGAPRMAALGLVLGLLPCMLTFWVLSLSVASASPLHGALLMAGLVLLTTPVLVLTGAIPALATSPRRARLRAFGKRVVPFALLLSGVWMALMAIAANGWIAHVHLPFRLGGELYVWMLW